MVMEQRQACLILMCFLWKWRVVCNGTGWDGTAVPKCVTGGVVGSVANIPSWGKPVRAAVSSASWDDGLRGDSAETSAGSWGALLPLPWYREGDRCIWSKVLARAPVSVVLIIWSKSAFSKVCPRERSATEGVLVSVEGRVGDSIDLQLGKGPVEGASLTCCCLTPVKQ